MNETLLKAERCGDIGVLTIAHPPVNALSHAVRGALRDAIEAADRDSGTSAIVIRGAGRHFVAGADIREFDAAARVPLLNDVLLRIESCGKPVVAALHGSVLGGGFELALACHYRIAEKGTSLGMPEIRLGLLPGSGGTQRLPRIVGAAEALRIMLDGEPISCERAAALGIVDRVSEGADLRENALAYARELIAKGAGPRRLRDRGVEHGMPPPEFINEQRSLAARRFPGVDSREAIIECVAAAVSEPFEAGLALSRKRFEECRQSTVSRALRHLFFAERTGRPTAPVRAVNTVGILGAGTMGSGIAISVAMAGFGVTLVDTNAAALAAGLERIRTTLEAAVAKGRLAPADAAAAIGRVRAGGEVDALAAADFVIEAVYEDLEIKRSLFASLSRVCKADAVLASNTSTLDIDAIAAAAGRPRDVIGMHFFSPANVMRLVEIVRGRATAADVIATTGDLARRIGKLGIVVGNCFGFVGNRMLYAYGRENQYLLLEGATPSQVDKALEEFGMAMGPNAVGDLAGLDVGYRVRRGRKDLPADPRYYRVADMLVEAGRLGQKTGRGAFAYPHGSRRPVRDADVEALIVAESARLGIPRREISDAEIRERCLFALVNEGALILAEGIADSPADIDAIWCNGYGFPRFRGGPMFHADTLGPAAVLAGIRKLADTHGARDWTPAPLLLELAASGETFAAWQARRTANSE